MNKQSFIVLILAHSTCITASDYAMSELIDHYYMQVSRYTPDISPSTARETRYENTIKEALGLTCLLTAAGTTLVAATLPESTTKNMVYDIGKIEALCGGLLFLSGNRFGEYCSKFVYRRIVEICFLYNNPV